MRIQLQGKTGKERHEITAAASDAVVAAGGYILDYNQFSNKAVCFTLELPSAGFAKLRMLLEQLGVDVISATSNEATFLSKAASDEMIPGSLRIDFYHNEPELRLTIPAVPG
jgi:hypothetical protein